VLREKMHYEKMYPFISKISFLWVSFSTKQGDLMTGRLTKDSSISSIFRKLFKSPNIETFLKSTEDDMWLPPFNVYITELCKQRDQVPEHVIRNSALERTFGHQLFNGTRKPSRDKVIELAFGFEMDIDETQQLLRIAQKSQLYPKIKRDAVILHCIQNKKSILETQSKLQDLGLTLLGGR
jgi:hypothetical protein